MKCKEPTCRKEIIYGITKNGKLIPIDYDSLTDNDLSWLLNRENDKELLLFRYGEHICHFATCTKASQFRRGDYDNIKK